MRHYAALSDSALVVLMRSFSIMEASLLLPNHLHASLISLLPKRVGGMETCWAVLFGSACRLWGRLRRRFAVDWEAMFDRPYLNAGAICKINARAFSKQNDAHFVRLLVQGTVRLVE